MVQVHVRVPNGVHELPGLEAADLVVWVGWHEMISYTTHEVNHEERAKIGVLESTSTF